MISYFKSTRFSLFILLILFLATSCNSNGGDEKKTDEKSSADTSKKESPVLQPTAPLIGGALDTLYTDSLTFVNLPKAKLVFRFMFKTDDHLTLHGWNAKGLLNGSYDVDPLIKLENGHPSGVTYGPDIYLGNVIIWGNDIGDIKKALKKNNAQYVIFLPQIINGKHIGYKILVGKEKPGLVKIFEAVETGIDANPSPPKNY